MYPLRLQLIIALTCTALTCTALTANCFAAEPKGLGDPGNLTAITVQPNAGKKGILIRGQDARQQLYVTGNYSSGQQHDHTQSVNYTAAPAGIVEVSSTGLVTPLKDGQATIAAKEKSGKTATVQVTVEGIANPVPINFKNQISPIFTKLGCNSGGCHGKASGQNGFKLSLLGFYPEDDYEFLVKEDRGRRLFPAAPEQSLLLAKATGMVPHGGGKRMEKDSYEYRLVYRWIQQGMPYGNEDDPHVVAIECLPARRVMDRKEQQQITVMARYSDGHTEDVTGMALYESNDAEMAETNKTGVVKTLDLAGEVAVMARYQGHVSTFRATVPLGAEIASIPKEKNFIDKAVFNKLKTLGIPPSPLSDDATFLRRVSIDIAGVLPTDEQARQFLEDKDPNKRDKLINRLLDSTAYADNFANKWNMVLRNKLRRNDQTEAMYAFYRWIWSSIYENKPYHEFVGEIIAASGQAEFNPPVAWYREVNENNEQVEDTAQLFLGVRIQCARCHHHPFEKWSQNDYYSLSAFFSRVGKKQLRGNYKNNNRDYRIFHNEGAATARNPRNNQSLKPAGLGSEPLEISAERDPRQFLVKWMADPNNPFFAKALVNRYWKHFFSRGIVDPEDDMRETNPPVNPELLEALAQHFIKTGFDLKELVRVITQSNTYQLSSLPNEYNLKDKQNFSRYYPKRLKAEVLFDALHQVTNSNQNYSGMPAGTKAIQLPNPAVGPYFLKVFGQPQADTACECERSQDANLAQSLHLLNSSDIQNKISNGSGRAAMLAKDDKRTHDDKVKEIYRWVYSREPKAEELKVALAHIDKNKENPKLAYEDIIWALLNTKEFLFNH